MHVIFVGKNSFGVWGHFGLEAESKKEEYWIPARSASSGQAPSISLRAGLRGNDKGGKHRAAE